MLAHVDFVEQDQVRTDDGLLRPDMVIKLAGGKNVVVDAKVAFLGFLDAAQATDERVRTERLAAHARHVRAHVDDLAGKRYWDQFAPAPEFVVMFVPAESFLHAAAEQDPLLIEYAFERNVVIATPTTLLALLRTVVLRVAAGRAGQQRAGRPVARQGAARPARDAWARTWPSSAAPSTPRPAPTTRRCRRSRPASWSAPDGSRTCTWSTATCRRPPP